MASSNAVDDKQQPYKRQQFKSSGMNRPIPIRNIYVGYIERNVSEQHIYIQYYFIFMKIIQFEKINKMSFQNFE